MVPLTGGSINERALRSGWGRDRVKYELQGRMMRELHRLHYLLPRPIPSVGDRGAPAPLWTHLRLRFAKPARRDATNYHVTIKALGDALVGPEWQGQPKRGQKRVSANRTMIYQGRAYAGGWLPDDTERYWLPTLDIDPHLGPARLLVWLVWDQPTDPA